MGGFKRVLLAGSAGVWMLGAAGSAFALAEADAGAPNEVEGVTVTGVMSPEPLVTKSDVALIDTPQAVSVISAETLTEQGITRLADALRGVAGVSRSSTYGYYDAYQIRGYDAAYGSIFLDGLTSGNVAGAVNELAGLEQVEVIKGPASALFGASPLGGVVNLVSKRPTADRFLTVGVATGSYNLAEVTVDANGALTADGVLTGRLNLVYRDSDDFVDFAHSQRIYVAPALAWQIGEDTRLTVLGRYQRDYDSPWSPVPAWGTILPSAHGELPINFSVNGTGAQRTVNNLNAKQIGYVFDHRFSENLRFSQSVRYEDRDLFWRRWIFAAGFLDDNVVGGVQQGHVLGRYIYGPFHENDTDLVADSRLTWKFNTGAIGHNLLVGVDYRANKNKAQGDGNYNPGDNPLDILAPNYATPYVSDPLGPYTASGKISQVGLYLHDHITLTDRLSITLGGRWDKAKADAQEDRKFSPHVGASWSLNDATALYVNYSKSFTPTPSWQTTFTGDLLPPETGENIEAGLKLQGARLSGLISIYQLTRQNVATDDPAHPFFYVVTGEQRSRGIEIEGAWQATEALQLTAAYAHTKAEITKDNVFPVGIPLPNFPENAANIWARYTVQSGPLAKLWVSLGATYASDRHFFEGGTLYSMDAYTLVNAGLSYPFGAWTAQLNIDNLTDERFFPDSGGFDRITPGEPRSWRVGLRRTF